MKFCLEKFITNCDKGLLQTATAHFITNCDKGLLQIETSMLFQIATRITNCDVIIYCGGTEVNTSIMCVMGQWSIIICGEDRAHMNL